MSATTRLIGVDCAANPKNVGLAAGYLDGGKIVITHVESRESHKKWDWERVETTVADWMSESENCLLAIDAPLGWPRPFGETLASHKAGAPIPKLQVDRVFDGEKRADQIFMRDTDRWIYSDIRKKPLAIGANIVARIALAALSFLDVLRSKTGRAIPLAWTPGLGVVKETSVIEVYPAATLKERGFSFKGYKNAEQAKSVRADIIERLESEVEFHENVKSEMRENHDVLDAVVCVLAAADFVKGDAVPPENMKLAKKEGWIWVKNLDEKPAVDLNEQAEALSAESGAANVSIHKTPGNRNRNGQITIRETQWPGNDHNAKICILECEKCKFRYGVNGSDIWERKCPNCQDGMPCSRLECPAVADGDIGDCRECRA